MSIKKFISLAIFTFLCAICGPVEASKNMNVTVHAELLQKYKNKCNFGEGNLFACFRAGKYYEKGLGQQKRGGNKAPDYKEAKFYYSYACTDRSKRPQVVIGVPAACAAIGNLYIRKQISWEGLRAKVSGKEDPHFAAANIYFKRACESGDWVGCSNLGDSYRLGRSFEKNVDIAIKLYRKGCKKVTYIIPCSEGARLEVEKMLQPALSKEEVSQQNYIQSLRDCKKKNNGKACYRAASYIRYKRAKRVPGAMVYLDSYKRGCKLGSVDSCYTLGVFYEEGVFFKPNQKKAAEHYKKACNLDIKKEHGLACGSYNAITR